MSLRRIKDRFIVGLFLLLAYSTIFPATHAASTMKLEQVGRWAPTGRQFLDVQLYGNHLYAGTFSSGWYVIDVSDPTSPTCIQSNRFPAEVWGMKVINGQLVVSFGNSASRYDLSDPSAPALIDTSRGNFTRDAELFESILIPGSIGLTWYRPGTASSPALSRVVADMQAENGYLYAVIPQAQGFYVIQKSGLMLSVVSTIAIPAHGIRISGDTALLASAGSGLRLYDLTNPAKPSFLTNTLVGTGTLKLELSGQYAYIASGTSDGVQVVDWSDRMNPKRVGSFNTAGSCNELCVSGDYVYVADGSNGILVLQQTITDLPEIIIQSGPPTNLVLRTGDTLSLAVEATSSAPLSYQWFVDELLPGETGPSLTIGNVNRSHSGNYSVQVTDGSSTLTFETTVRVLGNLTLSFVAATIPPVITITDPFGPVDAAYLTLETSTNLIDWTPLDTPIQNSNPEATVTAGLDPSEPARFYRIIETP